MQSLEFYRGIALRAPELILLVSGVAIHIGMIAGWLLKSGLDQIECDEGAECIERLEYLLS
jgi:hypothetical protein